MSSLRLCTRPMEANLFEYAQLLEPLTCAAPAVTHATRLTPMIERAQKTVEVPQIQDVDKIVDALVVTSHQRIEDVSVGDADCPPGRESFSMETESTDGMSDSENGLVKGRRRAGVKWTRLVKGTRQGEDLDLLPVTSNREAGGSSPGHGRGRANR